MATLFPIVPWRWPFWVDLRPRSCSLGAAVLGGVFSTLQDGVVGQLARKLKTDGDR